MINAIKCIFAFHKWIYFQRYLMERECVYCNKKEMYAYMSYTVGWKWIKREK